MAATAQATKMMVTVFRKKTARQQAAIDFDTLYRQNLRPVYAFIAYRVGNKSTAEDITSLVFEKAWRSLDSYDPRRASVTSWLFIIARSCVIDYLRGCKRDREVPLESDAHADTAAGPERRLEAGEERYRLLSALELLDERERDIIAMKFGGGRSNKEIAAIMSLSATNVSTILFRSLDKMKTQLESGI